MKAFSFACVASLATVMVMAAPDLSTRQNDIKKCKDGIQGPSGGYDKRVHNLAPLYNVQRSTLANMVTFRG